MQSIAEHLPDRYGRAEGDEALAEALVQHVSRLEQTGSGLLGFGEAEQFVCVQHLLQNLVVVHGYWHDCLKQSDEEGQRGIRLTIS